ncbi:MAG: UvrD-helicase domain-containing protein [Gracilimonas sp.]|uniref:ATP-dependent helicase n=1 Tax=Gracilimonas TaxID=649462 RepID=UPI001B17F5DD|nr:UvrD-helicase domain-containing protein [Gracilimonas sp.]MBO6586572.1 UvrD-helicase domain-containing protein [Gracilimonas sp.]MBO6615229.1 UvrD-helicase domain-containing protein [Gracilimonas sp.]
MKTFSLPSEEPKGRPDFLSGLNKQQKQAVTHTDGPLLIVAGAGSGKTRVLTYRIAYLLQQYKAAPEQILALTFTNKAAREMKERIQNLIGDKAKKLWMGTFHSIFSKILRFEADKIGYGADFTIYDTNDSQTVIKQILQELNFDPKEIKPKTIHNKISDSKNQLIEADTYQDRFVSSTLDDITARVYKIYNKRLKQSNAMDFDDLLVKPIQLFEEHPDILEKYQDRFKYILIDEYQDTNHAQYKVTKLLAAKYENICVVGDDAQSIYSFRGADISNILNFKEDYEDATQVPLEQNYRSTKAILQCADSIIKQNTKQLDKTLWTDQDYGERITVLENFDERDEANRVASHIQNLKMKHGYKNNDFAILYRTNYQSRVFEEALRRKDLAYQLVGGLSFYQRKEIKDVLAYLTLLVNPHDETNLLRIINEPSRGIGNKSIQDLIKQAREESSSIWNIIQNIEELDVYKPAKARVREFVDMINRLRSNLEGGESISDTVKAMLEQSGYMRALVEENSHESMMRRDNIIELQNAISYYEKGKEKPSLSAFLQEISLITDTDKFDEDKPAITLMTVHASKGLEFPCVFIVGLEENLFPMGARDNFDVDIEEERRLFYVAITRAEERLYFSHCRSRFKFGEEMRQSRSRFLDEVDAGVVQTETGATISQKKDRFENKSSGDSGRDMDYDWKQAHTKKTYKSPSATIHYDYEDGEDPFQVGTKVIHSKFGPGKIISRSGLGTDAKVVVFFKNRGQKKLMLRAAPLQVID